MYGLLERDLENIYAAIKEYAEIEEVVLFGSRAMANYKIGSDVDIAVKGKEVDKKTILKLSDDLNEVYPLPYFFDVIDYNTISNDRLKAHIDLEGKVIYKRNQGEGSSDVEG